jgi:pilus assembly protein CpaB
MNTQRVIVLGIALVAAGAAAFMVRSLIGGGTPQVQAQVVAPPPVPMSEVLVASANLQPGQKLTPDMVRWEKWPKNSVDQSFITHETVGSPDEAVKDTVVRVPVLANQPVVATSIVHGDAGGIMAAMLTPGMRAVSIVISAESGAGGFILPNDRVDVILTRKFDGTPPRVASKAILSNVRVLAVDQTITQAKDTKSVIGKTATVELTPEQAELIASAQGAGQLSLALRPLGDNQPVDAAAEERARKKKSLAVDMAGPVNVIRYGLAAPSNPNQNQEKPQ